ncbi:hypothetical protein L1049_020104 [Liquidambar formosana]|uniref:Uncharacterized protein n=1 Tax=Liquidambar formosana TaxID=63359 RepID=A0AAP0SCM2_LIQFO
MGHEPISKRCLGPARRMYNAVSRPHVGHTLERPQTTQTVRSKRFEDTRAHLYSYIWQASSSIQKRTFRDGYGTSRYAYFFDAVCAESNGWKFGFSLAPSPAKEERSKVSTSLSSTEVNKKEKAGGSSPPVNAKRTEHQQQKRNPRFAPELDGVHCFETIVPY